nr:unnamed protein product [Callosobruchus analis]
MVSAKHIFIFEEMTDEVNEENKNLESQTDRNWKKQTIPNLKNKISNVLKRPLESNLLTQSINEKIMLKSYLTVQGTRF